MYRGFNLRDFLVLPSELEHGISIYEKQKSSIRTALDDFINPNGIIDGSALQQNWFPQNHFDVFISHSHHDRNIALTLAGTLNKLGVSAFIDSSIWGHSDELLRMIDEKYCYDNTSSTFNYQLRNFTTSHVHMMLSNALTKMIDNCECMFFINSQNSINIDSVINKTSSPWLYSELAIFEVIRKIKPNRKINKAETKFFNRSANESLAFEYEVNLSNLTELSINDFETWFYKINDREHVLDTLYKLKTLSKLLHD